jgi:hypothetical protein
MEEKSFPFPCQIVENIFFGFLHRRAKRRGLDRKPHISVVRTAIQSVLEIEDHDARLLAGAKAYRLVTQSVAHHLEHMIYEETVIMDLFRTKLSDPEIDAIEAVVVKHLPPSMLQACTPIFIRYHNTQGRAYLLNIIKASAPPPAFAGVCGLAKSLLSAQEVESLEKALGFPLTA